ncbi:hypothetical protein ACFL0W_00930 [Nanoarchaeota archaeon]
MKQKKLKDILGKNKKLLSTKRNFLLGKPSGQEGSSRVLAMASLFVIAIIIFVAYSYFSGDKTDDTEESEKQLTTIIKVKDPKIIFDWKNMKNPASELKKEKYMFEDLSDEHTEALLIIEKKLTSTLINQAWEDSNPEEKGNLCFNIKNWFNNIYIRDLENKCQSYEDDDDLDEYGKDTTEVTTDTYQEETTEETSTECIENYECEDKYGASFSCIKGKCKEKGGIWDTCDFRAENGVAVYDPGDCKFGLECRKFYVYTDKPICWHPQSDWPEDEEISRISCLTDSDCGKITREEKYRLHICSERECVDVSGHRKDLTDFCDSDNPCEEGMCKEDEHKCVECLENTECPREDESCIKNECGKKGGLKEPCDKGYGFRGDRDDCKDNYQCIEYYVDEKVVGAVCWYSANQVYTNNVHTDSCVFESDCDAFEEEFGESFICVGSSPWEKKCKKESDLPPNSQLCDKSNSCEDLENFYCDEGLCKAKIGKNQPCKEVDGSNEPCQGEMECVQGTCTDEKSGLNGPCDSSSDCEGSDYYDYEGNDYYTCVDNKCIEKFPLYADCNDHSDCACGQCSPVEKNKNGNFNIIGKTKCLPPERGQGESCSLIHIDCCKEYDTDKNCIQKSLLKPCAEGLNCDYSKTQTCIPDKPAVVAQKR